MSIYLMAFRGGATLCNPVGGYVTTSAPVPTVIAPNGFQSTITMPGVR